jgi:hypothetical protein
VLFVLFIWGSSVTIFEDIGPIRDNIVLFLYYHRKMSYNIDEAINNISGNQNLKSIKTLLNKSPIIKKPILTVFVIFISSWSLYYISRFVWFLKEYNSGNKKICSLAQELPDDVYTYEYHKNIFFFRCWIIYEFGYDILQSKLLKEDLSKQFFADKMETDEHKIKNIQLNIFPKKRNEEENDRINDLLSLYSFVFNIFSDIFENSKMKNKLLNKHAYSTSFLRFFVSEYNYRTIITICYPLILMLIYRYISFFSYKMGSNSIKFIVKNFVRLVIKIFV